MRSILLLPIVLAIPSAWAMPEGYPTAGPIRFLAFGDSGTGSPAQLAVAKAMEEVCKERGCQFAIGAGDNIYELGARSDDDAQFGEKFEKPYAALKFPFFMALGNHDESGTIPGSGVHPENGEHELQYTKKSQRWMMPARYYRFAAPVRNPADYASSVVDPIVELFAIDTNPLAPQNMPVSAWYRANGEFDRGQRAWLRQALKSSTARWKIVFGHHPYLNNGKHRNAGHFFGLGLSKGKELKKMVEELVCGQADLLVTGHDHSLQWLKADSACGTKPQFIITGASAKTNESGREKNPAEWEAYNTLGFFWLEATKEKLRVLSFTVDASGKWKLAHEGEIH
jgi:hypothetical protein